MAVAISMAAVADRDCIVRKLVCVSMAELRHG
jgi:hypothetical protein